MGWDATMSGASALQQALICANCRGALHFHEDIAECLSCGSSFANSGGTWDFILGDRFPDDLDCCRWEKEEFQDVNRAENYMIPLFRSIQAARGGRPLRLLSVGCGVAAEVDRINDAGFECFGIECGNRAEAWAQRKYRSNLMLANGMHLPFRDGYFDIVFAGCVFPHVGVVGDTYQVRPDCKQQRLSLAREMVRVTDSEGRLVISCPNRLFPMDLFHRLGKNYMPRFHLPNDQFLLSLGDFRAMFVDQCGCLSARALPVAKYWTFNELTRFRVGRMISTLLGGYMGLVSMRQLQTLHGSFASPWLVVEVRR